MRRTHSRHRRHNHHASSHYRKRLHDAGAPFGAAALPPAAADGQGWLRAAGAAPRSSGHCARPECDKRRRRRRIVVASRRAPFPSARTDLSHSQPEQIHGAPPVGSYQTTFPLTRKRAALVGAGKAKNVVGGTMGPQLARRQAHR
eukprot:scaffold27777_cov129-Isochrysis_galbana.AAC.7